MAKFMDEDDQPKAKRRFEDRQKPIDIERSKQINEQGAEANQVNAICHEP
jgi:hypothetical protein